MCSDIRIHSFIYILYQLNYCMKMGVVVFHAMILLNKISMRRERKKSCRLVVGRDKIIYFDKEKYLIVEHVRKRNGVSWVITEMQQLIRHYISQSKKLALHIIVCRITSTIYKLSISCKSSWILLCQKVFNLILFCKYQIMWSIYVFYMWWYLMTKRVEVTWT